MKFGVSTNRHPPTRPLCGWATTQGSHEMAPGGTMPDDPNPGPRPDPRPQPPTPMPHPRPRLTGLLATAIASVLFIIAALALLGLGYAPAAQAQGPEPFVIRPVGARTVEITARPGHAGEVVLTGVTVGPLAPFPPCCAGEFVFSWPHEVTLGAATRVTIQLQPREGSEGEVAELVVEDEIGGIPSSGAVRKPLQTFWSEDQFVAVGVRGNPNYFRFNFPPLKRVFLPLVSQRLEWAAVREQCMLPEGCPTATPARP